MQCIPPPSGVFHILEACVVPHNLRSVDKCRHARKGAFSPLRHRKDLRVPRRIFRKLSDRGIADARRAFRSLSLPPRDQPGRLVLEAARFGYRVLVTVNNPITRFLIGDGSQPAQRSRLQSRPG